MNNTINLEQLSRNIVQTTASLLLIEKFHFNIEDKDLIFVEDVGASSQTALNQTKQLFSLQIAKPLYDSSGDTIVFDRNFQKMLHYELEPT